MISPEDLNKATKRIDSWRTDFYIKEWESGVKTLQRSDFNEDGYFRKMSDVLKDYPGLSANNLAEKMKINQALIKDLIEKAQ